LTAGAPDDGTPVVNDTPPSQPRDDSNARAKERAEAAAVRRRWITLGEVLAVLAVGISGLTLWNNWTDRRETKAEQTASATRAASRTSRLVLVAGETGKHALSLKPSSSEQTVQSQTILFPPALQLSPAETTGEPRIDAEWFEHALVGARNAAHLPDASRGDERLPVVIVTQVLADGEPHEDVALYDLGYTISGKFISGHSLTLRGISLVTHLKRDQAGAKLDARWAKALAGAGGS
jgi:hypothetical protein